MEVAEVLVTHRAGDLVHGQAAFAQQARRHFQPPRHQQRAEGRPAHGADAVRQVFRRISQAGRQLREGGVGVVPFEVGAHRLPQAGIGRGDAQPALQRFFIIRQVRKQQRHQLREDAVPARRLLCQGKDEVVHQVADGEHVFGLEEQVFPLAVLVEVAGEEAAHHVVVFHVVEHILQKGVGEDEVDAHVSFPRPQDAVADVLVQQQNVAALQGDAPPFDDVRDAARVHIHELGIVVPVFGEVDKAGVQAHVDLARAQHLFAVDDELFGEGVVVLFHLLPAEDEFFLCRKAAKVFDDLCVHASILSHFPKKSK